jgi:hypothetical protein
MRLLDSDLLPTRPLRIHDFPIGDASGTDAVITLDTGTDVAVLADVDIPFLPESFTVTGATTFVSPLQMAAEEYDGDFDFDLDLEDDDDDEEDEEVEDDDEDEEDDDDDDDDEFPSEEEDDD